MENSTLENFEKITAQKRICLHMVPCLFEQYRDLHCVHCNQVNLSIESKKLSELNIAYKPQTAIKICRPYPNKSYFVGVLEPYQLGWLISMPLELQEFDLTFNWSMMLNPYEVTKREYKIKHRCHIELVDYVRHGEDIYSTQETITRGFPRKLFTPFGEEEIHFIKTSRVKRLWEKCLRYHADGIETLLIEETVLLPKLSKEYAASSIDIKYRSMSKTIRACRCPGKKALINKQQERMP